jgi:hypothetical protein
MKPLLDYLNKDKEFDEDEQILTDLSGMETYLKNIYKF